ncbi:hypothetical protein HPB48_020378 [Haemaphysalis longicornis]|uniref:Uncharacterized protein n=1 Tax=Haemaphysalis longicornis TaxID=44386 RepID=A0A9J6FXX1_HAELO|nr:hypothetical protein HPB48_020378 [Haemaphysalis longicornis]
MQSDGGGGLAVEHILRHAEPILNMMRRVTTHSRGLKEQDLLQLHDALILSRIRYQAPYVVLTRTLEGKLGALIRKATKISLGLPIATSTIRLAQLGVLPTVTDINDIHRSHQRQRLSETATGLHIVRTLGYPSRPRRLQTTAKYSNILP